MPTTNPFTLAPTTTAPERTHRDVAEAATTPYATLCANTSRPSAFTMTFLEPLAA